MNYNCYFIFVLKIEPAHEGHPKVTFEGHFINEDATIDLPSL
jgi:hypothetical protein